MILFIEPVSNNIGMYVPAYPLPLLEIASFVHENLPRVRTEIISIPMDYGLPLTKSGKQLIYNRLMNDIGEMKPTAVGISCTAISQAEEVIQLAELIKSHNPGIFIFIGGYFPTIYYEEIFSRTTSVDIIVTGEGEVAALEIIRALQNGIDPRQRAIPNLAWQHNGGIQQTENGRRFDLNRKAVLQPGLLRNPGEYEVLPYSFSRGCPYRCRFCMEDYIRPVRREVPHATVALDLTRLTQTMNASTLLVSDALFKSFDLFPWLRSLGLKINFETRCDVMDPNEIAEIADVGGMLAMGFESASYDTLRRMNKVRDRDHYKRYLANTEAIFKEACRYELPVIVFMIAGFPGDTRKDLETSLAFAQRLAGHGGEGGHIFKIGECHVYPKTKIHDLALSMPDVRFDDNGVFGQNVVRQPSAEVDFKTVAHYTKTIFQLSRQTPKIQEAMGALMPFFRMPVAALQDPLIPENCYTNATRDIFRLGHESLALLRRTAPDLREKYRQKLAAHRGTRTLKI